MSLFSSSNRRIKKGAARRSANPLEISVRPDKERAHVFRKRFAVFLKVVALAGLSVGSVVGGRWAVKRFVWENPSYALSDLRISTDGLLTRAQILEICGLREGENIFRLDLPKAKQALDQLPQVERVDVRRILPDRVDVRISERQPVAWVAPSPAARLGVDADAYLVDVRGYVMRTRKVLPEHLALPIITGVVMEDVAPGQKLPTAESMAAIELIRLSADNLRWHPRVVDVSKGYCLTVFDNRKARITFGFEGLEDQLAKLQQLIELVEPTQKEFVSVNLMLERNIPVVFATPAAAPGSPDKKDGKTKGTPLKTAGISPSQKPQEDPRFEPVVPSNPARQSTVASMPFAGVSGGVLETVKDAVVSSTISAPASQPSEPHLNAAKPAGGGASIPKLDLEKDSKVKKTVEETEIRPRIPAKLVPVAAQTVSGAPVAASAPAKETLSKNGSYKKYSKSKTTRSPARVRRVSGTGADVADRSGSASSSRPVRGVGPVSKGASPSATKPSLNPTEALRKLFSPHG